MINNLTSLKKAVKGQTIKHFKVSDDDTVIIIVFESGKTLTVSGKLIDSINISATLEVELVDA